MINDEEVLTALDYAIRHPAFRQYPHATQDRIASAKRRLEQRLRQKEEQHGEGRQGGGAG